MRPTPLLLLLRLFTLYHKIFSFQHKSIQYVIIVKVEGKIWQKCDEKKGGVEYETQKTVRIG